MWTLKYFIFKPQLFSSHVTHLYARLTEFLLLALPALFCLFICPSKQSEEHSWSGMLVFRPYRAVHRNFIIVGVFRSHCLLLCSLTCLSPFLLYFCCGFTFNMFVVFVCVAFVFGFNRLTMVHRFHFRNNTYLKVVECNNN